MRGLPLSNLGYYAFMNFIIDVREPHEYSAGHVEGAINIPLSTFSENNDLIKGLDKEQDLVLYCRSGNRSAMAINFLKSMGFKNLTNGINQERVIRDYM